MGFRSKKLSARLAVFALIMGVLALSLIAVDAISNAAFSGRVSKFVSVAGMSEGQMIGLPETKTDSIYMLYSLDASPIHSAAVSSQRIPWNTYNDVSFQAIREEIGIISDPSLYRIGRNVHPVGLRKIRSPTSHLIYAKA